MRKFAFIIFIGTLPGLCFVRFANDASRFYAPDPLMVRGEKAVAEALGNLGETSFAVTRGATLQEALENEEKRNVFGLSALVPSLARQRENHALVAAFAAAGGETPPLFDPVTPETLPIPVDAMVMQDEAGVILFAQNGDDFNPKRELDGVFSALARESSILLAVSFAVLIAVLLAMRSLRVFLPVAAAILSTMGVLGYLGMEISCFQLLAFFAIAGLGFDYAIFHASGNADRKVLASFLTSLAGLGMLAFTSFAVTRSMGIVFALGLSFAWFYSRHVVRTA